MRRSLGMLILAIYLLLSGLFSLIPLGFPGFGNVLALFAIAAGILILMGK